MKAWFKRFKKPMAGLIFALIVGSGAGASFAPYLSPVLIEGVIDAATNEEVS